MTGIRRVFSVYCSTGIVTVTLSGVRFTPLILLRRIVLVIFLSTSLNISGSVLASASVSRMEAAFREGEEWLEQLLPYLADNFDFVVNYCETRIPRIKTFAPDATYLMWLDCRALGLTNQQLHDFMIEKAGLGLNDGCSFGRSLEGYMRLNAACPRSVLMEAMGRLEAAVNSL